MGFFKSLFQRKPTTVEDDYLGTLTLQRGFWEGTKHIAHARREVQVSFFVGDEPPTAKHINFFRQVEQRLPALMAEFCKTMFADFDDLPDGVTREKLFDSLQLDNICFENLDTTPETWEITFSTELDPRQFVVAMEGFEQQGLEVDG